MPARLAATRVPNTCGMSSSGIESPRASWAISHAGIRSVLRRHNAYRPSSACVISDEYSSQDPGVLCQIGARTASSASCASIETMPSA